MRVTNSMIAQQTLHNITSSLRRLDRYNQQLSTGRRINMPSDDPAGTEVTIRLETAINETEQYLENVADAISWLDATDSALNQISLALHRARELAVYGASDTLGDDSRMALAEEADQFLQDLIQVGNLKFGYKYLFGGANTLDEPFSPLYGGSDGNTIQSVTYRGTPSTLGLDIEISHGINMGISVHGDEAIMPAIEALIHLRDNLRAGNTAALATGDGADPTSIDLIDEALDTITRWRAEAGARVNRLEHVKGRMEQVHTNLTRLLSETVDADIAETVMNLKMEENVYRMALASGARIIQPTLLDFLR